MFWNTAKCIKLVSELPKNEKNPSLTLLFFMLALLQKVFYERTNLEIVRL